MGFKFDMGLGRNFPAKVIVGPQVFGNNASLNQCEMLELESLQIVVGIVHYGPTFRIIQVGRIDRPIGCVSGPSWVRVVDALPVGSAVGRKIRGRAVLIDVGFPCDFENLQRHFCAVRVGVLNVDRLELDGDRTQTKPFVAGLESLPQIPITKVVFGVYSIVTFSAVIYPIVGFSRRPFARCIEAKTGGPGRVSLTLLHPNGVRIFNRG